MIHALNEQNISYDVVQDLSFDNERSFLLSDIPTKDLGEVFASIKRWYNKRGPKWYSKRTKTALAPYVEKFEDLLRAFDEELALHIEEKV